MKEAIFLHKTIFKELVCIITLIYIHFKVNEITALLVWTTEQQTNVQIVPAA